MSEQMNVRGDIFKDALLLITGCVWKSCFVFSAFFVMSPRGCLCHCWRGLEECRTRRRAGCRNGQGACAELQDIRRALSIIDGGDPKVLQMSNLTC